MNALAILIPIGLGLAAIAVGIFFWATRHGQFDDLDSPAILPLLDNEPAPGNPQRDVRDNRAPGATFQADGAPRRP